MSKSSIDDSTLNVDDMIDELEENGVDLSTCFTDGESFIATNEVYTIRVNDNDDGWDLYYCEELSQNDVSDAIEERYND